ncbi:MAG: OB-fold nucleic acid binding domain-containing protein, partial [Cytophagales bacterium]
RLGFRQVKGFKQEEAQKLLHARGNGFTSIRQLLEIGFSGATLEKLADADAFRSLGSDRREALWHVANRDYQPQSFFSSLKNNVTDDNEISLPKMKLSEQVVQDYATTSLSLKAHPVSFVRAELNQLRALTHASLETAKNGDWVKVAGLVLVRQRPGTATGICFITLEDETGIANLVVFSHLFDKYRKEIIQSRLLMVEGQLQREGEVVHVIVKRCFNISPLLQKLTGVEETQKSQFPLFRSDETTSKPDQRVFHKGRNFR